MKILSAEDLRKADKLTIETQGLSSIDLMERASATIFQAIKDGFGVFDKTFIVICGSGNNGGDGLALARMIFQAGREVKTFLIDANQYSDDNTQNQKRVSFTKIKLDYNFEFSKGDIIIDGLFGIGLNRPLSEDWEKMISQINSSGCRVISIDMPSGLITDGVIKDESPWVAADLVYTFHCPKKALMLPDNRFEGEFKVLDIGLIEGPTETKDYYLEQEFISGLLKPVSRFSHKGSFGHALIIGGSRGKVGSVILSTSAALRTGCGLITAFIPECGYIPVQSAFPEAMVYTDATFDFISSFPEYIVPFSSIGIGIGLGTHPQTIEALGRFLKEAQLPPLVLDADALNILSLRREYLKLLPENSIITPHPGELERLIGKWDDDIKKLEKVKALAHIYKIIVIVKGAYSNIIMPDGRVFFNSTGNAGMATAGSGDVLTGIIASLLAQRYTPEEAALIGVQLHGLAGDWAIENIHPKSLIASDIVNSISLGWKQLININGAY